MSVPLNSPAAGGNAESPESQLLHADLNDNDLFARIHEHRDARALEALWHRYALLLKEQAAICLNRFESEDIVQEVFLSVWLRKPSPAHGKCRSFLIRCTRNKAISQLRKQDHRVLRDPMRFDALTADSRDGYERPEPSDLWAAVQKNLSPELISLLELKFEEGCTFAELARRHGVSVRTVKRWVDEAKREIADIIRNIKMD